MIKVNDNYLIDVDELNWTVYENKPKQMTDKRSGKVYTIYPAVGYYGSLKKALLAVGDRMVRNELKNADTDLPDALHAVINVTDGFQSVMERILKEAES